MKPKWCTPKLRNESSCRETPFDAGLGEKAGITDEEGSSVKGKGDESPSLEPPRSGAWAPPANRHVLRSRKHAPVGQPIGRVYEAGVPNQILEKLVILEIPDPHHPVDRGRRQLGPVRRPSNAKGPA